MKIGYLGLLGVLGVLGLLDSSLFAPFVLFALLPESEKREGRGLVQQIGSWWTPHKVGNT